MARWAASLQPHPPGSDHLKLPQWGCSHANPICDSIRACPGLLDTLDVSALLSLPPFTKIGRSRTQERPPSFFGSLLRVSNCVRKGMGMNHYVVACILIAFTHPFVCVCVCGWLGLRILLQAGLSPNVPSSEPFGPVHPGGGDGRCESFATSDARPNRWLHHTLTPDCPH